MSSSKKRKDISLVVIIGPVEKGITHAERPGQAIVTVPSDVGDGVPPSTSVHRAREDPRRGVTGWGEPGVHPPPLHRMRTGAEGHGHRAAEPVSRLVRTCTAA